MSLYQFTVYKFSCMHACLSSTSSAAQLVGIISAALLHYMHLLLTLQQLQHRVLH